jgi:chemotaxis protein CheX
MSSPSQEGAPPPQRLELPEILDLKAAMPLVAEFLHCRGRDLCVDASKVHRLGAQCLQVLLSADLTWKADEAALCFTDPSPDFLDGLSKLGIDPKDLIDQDLPR